MILGAIDPLEGSVLIVLASAMILSGVYIIERGSKTFKLNLYAFLMILAGTVVMFYLSFLGGVGGNTGISSWFMLFVLPYPLGWLLAVILIVIRLIKYLKRKKQV
jgi:ABC-type branched-subunit amino acid transport system permease subunit